MPVLSGPQVAAICKRAGWTGENLVIAIAVAKAESGWNTNATNRNNNGTLDRGLMQINTVHRWTLAQNMFDPQLNANAGMRIWREAGNRWRPWSTFNAGRHLRYMNEARAAAAGAGNVTGPIGGDTAQQSGITYGPPGPRIVVAGPAVTLAAELDRPGKLGVFQFIGGKLSETFDGEVVGTIEYEQGISTIPNCEISIIDPEGALFKKLDALWYRGTTVRYIDMDMTVNEVKFEGGEAGTGMITVKLIDSMVYKLMQLQGARTANNISATEWLAQECKLAGMDPNKMFLGESVPSQSVIARQVEQEEQAAGAQTTPAAAPATGVSGTVRYDGTNPRLDTDGTQAPPFSDPNRQNQTSVPGLNAITQPYVVVDNASQLRKQYLVRNLTTNKQVVAIGGDIGHGFGEISYAAAQALGMNIKSNAMPAHHIIISDYTGTGTTAAAASTAAPATVTDGAGNKVLPDVAGTTPVPNDSSKLIPDKRSEGKTDAPSGFSTGTVLAKELGKRWFATGNRLIFGSAGFCLQFARPLDQNEYLGWGTYPPGHLNRFLTMPEVDRVAVGKREGVIQIKGKILNYRAAYLRSGSSVLIGGIPGVADARFMVSKIKHSLGTDIDGAEIELLQPVNPPPEPPQTGGGQQAGGGAITGGTGSIDKFISLMLAQTGDRYVFGISVNRNDPNPSAFDCAELTSWAAWQAGIRPYLIPGSQAQRAQCKRFRQISVRQAINTKGALLFTSGHVAASLGNGRTIEAYQTGKPVGQRDANPASKWADAALIPGAAGYRLGPG